MNLKSSDLGLLLAFDALMTVRNVTRAARRLGISQPAMSARLARLRALFGDLLFVPSGRSLAPTSQAEALAAPLGRALYRETFLLAQRRGRPRGEAAPDLDAFCALSHLLVSTEGGGFRGAADAALAWFRAIVSAAIRPEGDAGH